VVQVIILVPEVVVLALKVVIRQGWFLVQLLLLLLRHL
jgi:hypothetical protein